MYIIWVKDIVSLPSVLIWLKKIQCHLLLYFIWFKKKCLQTRGLWVMKRKEAEEKLLPSSSINFVAHQWKLWVWCHTKVFQDCCYQTPAQETQPRPKLYEELQAFIQLAIHLQASWAYCARETGHSPEWEPSDGPSSSQPIMQSSALRLLSKGNEWLALQHEWC